MEGDLLGVAAEPQPFFGWLDYDDRDAQRMREVLAAFDDKGTIDSLGLGTIRDAIADQLFPGISTIQTRARYFFFVPWICQILEYEGTTPHSFAERLRELELALVESLRPQEGPNTGVIGYRARKRLKRLPSSVYWNGLGVFAIRRLRLNLTEYSRVCRQLGELTRTSEVDDDGDVVVGTRRMWDPALPEPPTLEFPSDAVSLTLTFAESEYLAGKIAEHCPDSMLGELARDLDVDRDTDVPWRIPLTHAPESLRAIIVHAQNFAELMMGAQTLYNLLLAERAADLLDWDTADLQEELVADMAVWEEHVAPRVLDLQTWVQGPDFWLAVERMGAVPMRTRRFVLEWARIALSDPGAVAGSSAARILVAERELQLKGKLARLSEQRALEAWNGEPFSRGFMTYRWPNAWQILDDIQNHDGGGAQ